MEKCLYCKENKPRYYFQAEVNGLRQFKYWCLICIAKLLKHGGRFI